MPRHLVSYFGNRYLDHFARDLNEIRAHGFNGVVHCATEADLHWGLDRLAEIFDATRTAGLECWADPWGVGGVFGGEAHSGFLGRNPAATQKSVTGEALPHACLSHPEFRRYMKEWVDGMARARAETIFWDEPHFAFTTPESWACACEHCTSGLDEIPKSLNDEVLDLRQRIALGFLDELTQHAASKGLKNSVCLYPMNEEPARQLGLPSLQDVAALQAVDDVGVDPYPVFQMDRPLDEFDAERFVGGWARKLADLRETAGVSVHLWIQGFALPEGLEHLILDCVDAARRNGVEDLALWGYRAAEVTSLIRPGNPQKVWELSKTAFGQTSANS